MKQIDLLVATIPGRRATVETLLAAVASQTIVPRVHLVLDRYEQLSAPRYPPSLDVVEYRMETTGGPGGRWRIVNTLSKTAILVNFDDDMCLMNANVVDALVRDVERGRASAYLGVLDSGWAGAMPRDTPLVAVAAGAMACTISDLGGVEETAREIWEKCGFDPFGPLGDDDAVISAHLWRKGVKMVAAGEIGVHEAPGAQAGGQFQLRRQEQAANGKHLFWQRREIAKATGWPWREPG